MKMRLTNAQRDWLHEKLQTWVNGKLTNLEPSVEAEKERIQDEIISKELLDDTSRWYEWVKDSHEDLKRAEARLKENIEYFVIAIKREYPKFIEENNRFYRYSCSDTMFHNYEEVKSFVHRLIEKDVQKRLVETEAGSEKEKLQNTRREIGDAVMLAGASGQLARVYQKLVTHFGMDNELSTILEVIKELADEDAKST